MGNGNSRVGISPSEIDLRREIWTLLGDEQVWDATQRQFSTQVQTKVCSKIQRELKERPGALLVSVANGLA